MTELFEDEEEDIIEEEAFVSDGDDIDIEVCDTVVAADGTLDARRRLENLLEEKRLREELDDFVDDY